MSTQLIGFSIGGINRKFLVDPPSMSMLSITFILLFSLLKYPGSLSSVWPANLVYCALFNTLHSQQYVGIGGRGGISRERFFTYVLVSATIYCEYF